jgi:hypothetical protein
MNGQTQLTRQRDVIVFLGLLVWSFILGLVLAYLLRTCSEAWSLSRHEALFLWCAAKYPLAAGSFFVAIQLSGRRFQFTLKRIMLLVALYAAILGWLRLALFD